MIVFEAIIVATLAGTVWQPPMWFEQHASEAACEARLDQLSRVLAAIEDVKFEFRCVEAVAHQGRKLSA